MSAHRNKFPCIMNIVWPEIFLHLFFSREIMYASELIFFAQVYTRIPLDPYEVPIKLEEGKSDCAVFRIIISLTHRYIRSFASLLLIIKVIACHVSSNNGTHAIKSKWGHHVIDSCLHCAVTYHSFIYCMKPCLRVLHLWIGFRNQLCFSFFLFSFFSFFE